MKNVLKIAGLLGLMLTVMLAMSSFTKVNDMHSEKSCKVTVYYANGDLADNLKVTEYSSGGYHEYKTDSKGVVVFKWEFFRPKYLYVKGDRYDVNYEDGKSYTLSLKKNQYD